VALKLLEKERRSDRAWIAQTRDLENEGIESLDRGEGVDGEMVVNNLLANLRFRIDFTIFYRCECFPFVGDIERILQNVTEVYASEVMDFKLDLVICLNARSRMLGG
jgi:hypothetical protein